MCDCGFVVEMYGSVCFLWCVFIVEDVYCVPEFVCVDLMIPCVICNVLFPELFSMLY